MFRWGNPEEKSVFLKSLHSSLQEWTQKIVPFLMGSQRPSMAYRKAHIVLQARLQENFLF